MKRWFTFSSPVQQSESRLVVLGSFSFVDYLHPKDSVVVEKPVKHLNLFKHRQLPVDSSELMMGSPYHDGRVCKSSY